jgi:poly(A)-specific ribonuclease
MEVTKENFESLFPVIDESITNCDFVAVDLELTGLQNTNTDAIDVLDDSQDRYSKLVDAARSFLPIQFGLACFQWNDQEDRYVSVSCLPLQWQASHSLTRSLSRIGCMFDLHSYDIRTFNFYLFPAQFKREADKRFTCQSSSITFLSGHNFDFNKLFRSGIQESMHCCLDYWQH